MSKRRVWAPRATKVDLVTVDETFPWSRIQEAGGGLSSSPHSSR